MKFSFTSNREVIEALVKTCQSTGYIIDKRVKLLGHYHEKGYSVAQLELTGELTDLIFLGLYTQSTIERSKNLNPNQSSLIAGHRYQLENFEGTEPQILQFIHKEADPVQSEPGKLITISDGTTNEEVLAVLIDRIQFLQSKFPCRENAIVITKLEESLMWLDKRTADRKSRNVEGKQLA